MSEQPRTKRGRAVLAELPSLIRGPWTPFREGQWTGTILAIETEATAAVPLDDGLNDAIWHVIRVVGNDEGCAELAEAARHLVTEYRRIFPPSASADEEGGTP